MNNDDNKPLYIEHGKFMRGKTEVAPVIGDREQISLLQRMERQAEDREKLAQKGKLKVRLWAEDIRFDAVYEFTCVCGNTIRNEERVYASDFSEVEDFTHFNGDMVDCPTCRRRYEINGNYVQLIGYRLR